MAVKKKLAILAAAILIVAAAALWLRAASAGESTFIRAVTNEAGLRQIFTNLDEDVYSLQPRHRIELTPDGTS